MHHLKRLTSRGDTIVEVMVVLAVLGLALSIAYATANRSLMGARQAQENSEATALAQSQIEQLRANVKITDTSAPTYIFRSGDFCMKDGAVVPYSGPSVPPSCVFKGRYNFRVVYAPRADAQGGKFTVTATWDNVAGEGQDSVTLAYRLYK